MVPQAALQAADRLGTRPLLSPVPAEACSVYTTTCAPIEQFVGHLSSQQYLIDAPLPKPTLQLNMSNLEYFNYPGELAKVAKEVMGYSQAVCVPPGPRVEVSGQGNKQHLPLFLCQVQKEPNTTQEIRIH